MSIDFDNPWSWHRPHTCLVSDSAGSGFDLGIDVDGDPIIHHDGYVRCVHPSDLEGVLELVEEVKS